MADKTQNIFINYKFPMAEAEKASQVLNRINQTNNLVQQTAQKTGQSISSAYGKAGTSIETMSIQLARLQTQIRLQNQGSTATAGLVKQYHELKKAIDAANKAAFETPKALKATATGAQSVTQQFGQLYTAAKLFVTAGVAKEAVDIALAMATLRGNVEGVERAFDRAFPNASVILKDLREATHGAVSDFELMQRTLQATNLGVAVEQLPVLFEFAAARAQQTGESVDYLVDSIVRGIGRKSPLILDNLGLSVSRLQEKFDGAAIASQSVADVTKGVAEIAREELQKMGGYAETAKTTVDQLRAAWDNFRANVAKGVDSTGLIAFIRDTLEGTNKLMRDQAEIDKEIAETRATVEVTSLKENQLNKQKIKDSQVLSDNIQQEINSRVELILHGKEELKLLKEKFDEASHTKNNTVAEINANIKIREELSKQGRIVVNNNKFYLETIDLLKKFLGEVEGTTDAVSTGIIERKKKEIEGIQDALEKTNNIGDLGVGGKLTKALEIAQAELGDLQRALSDIDPIKFEFSIDKATESLNRLIKAAEKINAGQMFGRFEEGLKNLSEAIPESLPELAIPTQWDAFLEDLGNAWDELRQEVAVGGVDILSEQLIASEQLELDSMKSRLKSLKTFYDEQQLLAGDNEKAKQLLRLREERETTKIQRQIFEKEKETRKRQAIIDGAAGVVKAFATYPYPAAIIISGLIALQTLSQIRIINRQRSGFKKGVIDLQGPGTSTSDSIPANLSKHESVMTAWETQHAGDVLREIRAKKLDNKVLKELKQGRPAVQQQQFNDERIIKAIKANRPPDVVEQSGIVYKVTEKNDTYRNKIRAKSVRL